MIPQLCVVEYVHGRIRCEWDGLLECSQAHGVSPETVKKLIYYGGSLDGHTTFDISVDCELNIRRDGDRLIVYRDRHNKTVVQLDMFRRSSNAVHQGSLCLPDGCSII